MAHHDVQIQANQRFWLCIDPWRGVLLTINSRQSCLHWQLKPRARRILDSTGLGSPTAYSSLPFVPIFLFIIHSHALNQSVIVERITCRSNILRYWTETYWTVANRGFFHGFSTLFKCFVNFKHTTSDIAE